MINSILTALNDKVKVGGIFCDLRKPFNCLDHKILIKKMKFYRIEGKFNSLIQSYLTGRFQMVTLGNSNDNSNLSKWKQIINGVPQGSILGPLLFLIYVNDLPKVVGRNSSMILSADDTSILITGSNSTDLYANIYQTFITINNWFNINSLTLNLNKTQFL